MSVNVSVNESCLFHLDNFVPHDNGNFPPSAIPTWITVIIVNSITAVPILYTNGLVIWTIFETANFRSVNSNFLFAMLSITDLLVGLVVQPIFVATKVCLITRCTPLCSIHVAGLFSSMLCIGWSFCTLVVISVERYIFIEYPMYYTSIITAKRLKAFVVTSWGAMFVILLFARVLFKDSDTARYSVGVLVPTFGVVVIVFCLTKVTLTARRQRRSIKIQQVVLQQTNHNVQNGIKEGKHTFTLGMLVLASALFYCPFIITSVINCIRGTSVNVEFGYVSESISFTCLHFQSLVNPFILSLRLSPIRKGVIRKIRAHFTRLFA